MLKLLVNGDAYDGWKSAHVTRRIECVAGGYDLEISDKWAGRNQAWPIVEEDSCTLTINDVPVITGYVDKRRLSFDKSAHSFQVSGRDRTASLVDCSAVLKSWEFHSKPLLSLAQDLAKPFNVTVTLDPNVHPSNVGTTSKAGKGGSVKAPGKDGKLAGTTGLPKPQKKFSIDPGESAWEVLDRACRMAGVLPVSDGQGGILLTRAGNGPRAVTPLVEGENILSASAEYDSAGRYSKYIVQTSQQGSDSEYAALAASVRGTAEDLSVIRGERVLFVRLDSAATRESAKLRAQWEAKIRAARGDSINVTVQGWQQGDGSLWAINSLVAVQSTFLGIDGDLLITGTDMSLDEGGTITRLTLMRPDAFTPEPSIGAKSALWKEIAGGVKGSTL